jgi:hypothetical protein
MNILHDHVRISHIIEDAGVLGVPLDKLGVAGDTILVVGAFCV